jgi:hypothetical protein
LSSVQAKKKALQKEKDSLDSADSNTILHSSGFTITQPASPGGIHSNRKTRHGRHLRQDQDNLEIAEGNKRKRKQPPEFDHESPGPGTRTLISGLGSLWEKSRPPEQNSSDITVEKYFTQRELITYHRQANMTVAESWAGRKPHRTPNGVSHLTNGDYHEEDGHRGNKAHHSDEDEEDPSNLVAPAMDRTGSHATRSTRNNQPDMTLPRDSQEGLKNPERIYGLAVLDALGARQQKSSTRGDLEAPWTSSLSIQEINEDRAYLESLADD